MIVLPPSFPFGGMENPRLTFATPTVLAGDKSLVSLVAHELAHSWSGNLVTNATWRDFWLNEGFTVYLEQRIMEARLRHAERSRHGDARSALATLEREMADLEPRDQVLHVDLAGRDPDDGFIERALREGRARSCAGSSSSSAASDFDRFLNALLRSSSRSRASTRPDFERWLRSELLERDRELAAQVDVRPWLTRARAARRRAAARSRALDARRSGAGALARGRGPGELDDRGLGRRSSGCTSSRACRRPARRDAMAELDRAFGLTRSAATARSCASGCGRDRSTTTRRPTSAWKPFLMNVGRRKFLKPLYTELAKTEAGRLRALAIYARARAGYHPIAQGTIDCIVGPPAPGAHDPPSGALRPGTN